MYRGRIRAWVIPKAFRSRLSGASHAMPDSDKTAVARTEPKTAIEPFTITDKNGKLRKYTPRSYDKLVGVDPQIILDRVAKGELMRDIALDYDCVVQTVSEYVKRTVDSETWAQVREHSIHARLEQSSHEIAQAADQLELARAREQARLWMWRAEREFPHLYATRAQTAVQINGNGEMQVQIVSYAGNNASQHPVATDNDSQQDT